MQINYCFYYTDDSFSSVFNNWIVFIKHIQYNQAQLITLNCLQTVCSSTNVLLFSPM